MTHLDDYRFWGVRVFGLAVLGIVTACVEGAGSGVTGQSSNELMVRGQVTDQGVECPTLLGTDGLLYSLAGDIGTARPGDEICVRGERAEMSICMQGTTIAVHEVLPPEACN